MFMMWLFMKFYDENVTSKWLCSWAAAVGWWTVSQGTVVHTPLVHPRYIDIGTHSPAPTLIRGCPIFIARAVAFRAVAGRTVSDAPAVHVRIVRGNGTAVATRVWLCGWVYSRSGCSHFCGSGRFTCAVGWRAVAQCTMCDTPSVHVWIILPRGHRTTIASRLWLCGWVCSRSCCWGFLGGGIRLFCGDLMGESEMKY